MEKTPKRMWINQPSIHQPLRYLNQTRVLAVPYTDTSSTIYFLDGDVVSQVCLNYFLSPGWPPSTIAMPPWVR